MEGEDQVLFGEYRLVRICVFKLALNMARPVELHHPNENITDDHQNMEQCR